MKEVTTKTMNVRYAAPPRLLLRSTYFIMHSFATAAALRMRIHIHDLCVLVLHAYITMIMMMK